MHEEAKNEQLKNNNTPEYYDALRLRQIWCEGNFAQQKARHNLQKRLKGAETSCESNASYLRVP